MDYRPHPKSPEAGDVFWTIVRGLQIRMDIVQINEADRRPEVPHPRYEEMLASYLDLSKQLEEELATVDESRDKKGGVQDVRAGRTGLASPRHPLDVPFRCDSSPRTAFHLSSTDGRNRSFNLRKVRR